MADVNIRDAPKGESGKMDQKNQRLEEAYRICVKKAEEHMRRLDPENLCEYLECTDGQYRSDAPQVKLGEKDNWMTSFVTGMAPLCYRTEKKTEYLVWANRCKKAYHDKVFLTPLESMHDIGFLYLPYSYAMYQLTGDIGHRDDALKAADELLKRFDIKGCYLDAWGRMDDDNRVGRAIIDSMMNIQLLFRAWKETGHTMYRDVAKAHMDTTIRYFVREDGTVCHSFEFDRKTGNVIREDNTCGYANGSYWSRGVSWMIYGLALASRYLEDVSYRELSVRLTETYLQQLTNGFVPAWDFRLPSELPAMKNRYTYGPEWDETDPANWRCNLDTSAAAIVSCAMLELDQAAGDGRYREVVKSTLEDLCTNYFNKDPLIPGMLSHSNGRQHYCIFGDYFFIQALQHFLYHAETCW